MKQSEHNNELSLLAMVDLAYRWNYTRAGIHKLAKRYDFPKPVAFISRKRLKVFLEADIANYEKDKPWLLNESQKFSRQYGYFYSKQKG